MVLLDDSESAGQLLQFFALLARLVAHLNLKLI